MARRNNKKEEKKPIVLESDDIKITIRPFEKDNLKGFATLELFDMITIYNCKVIDGKEGPFLSMPSYKGSDDNYYNYVYIDKDSEEAKIINELIYDAYNIPD